MVYLPMMMTVRVFLLVVLFVSSTKFELKDVSAATMNSKSETDRASLLALKDGITANAQGILNSWNDSSSDFCHWKGVICGRRHRRVISLELPRSGLIGWISPSIGNLTFLRSIDLSNNSFYGIIPQEIGQLSRLQYLLLSHNSLGGDIPSNLSHCSQLRGLYLDMNNLEGKIPKEITTLSKLVEFTVASNNLSGGIPHSIGNMSSLQQMSMAYNNLEGSIPYSIAQLRSLIYFSIAVNKFYGTLPAMIYNISSLKLLSLTLNRLHGELPQDVDEFNMIKLSYEDLFKATNGFSETNLIGSGSFGCVYKGVLGQDETIVAVKVLNLQQRGAPKSFKVECNALRNIRHRNLVKILTSCSSIDSKGDDFKALVYEFMPNGSLEQWLHPRFDGEHSQSRTLSLVQRITILVDVASALEYLHHYCHARIVHCDLKPSNILLDADMSAHVGDFGLARLFSQTNQNFSTTQSSTIGMKGSIGYYAPEYGVGGEASSQGDVYSFGILLLEMMTGRRPTDEMFDDGVNLHIFAKMAIPERVIQIVDPELLTSGEIMKTDEGTRKLKYRMAWETRCQNAQQG
ncbi:hypothetical protein Sjap_002493 [Stephania japonica]|uniref:non-specific serine/threonine protein kinase n=1 Tax=Stephania japonica TaxID=461633 RepID=A0AAP0KNK0_9MAGN